MALRSILGVLVVASGLMSSSARAQEARGTIQGRVVDASGGAVPGATVEVLNIATGVVTPTTTNAEGSSRVPFLIPGAYRVTVVLEGFSKFISDTIEVHVADLLTVDGTLDSLRPVSGRGPARPGRGQPQLDASGKLAAFVGCSADITEILESQRALKEADRRKDEFLAVLAHELRNPLASNDAVVD